MFKKLIKEPLVRAETSLLSQEPVNIQMTNFPIEQKFSKNRIRDLVEIEYSDPSSDLSEFQGIYMPKDFDFTIICETGKYFVYKDEIDKIIENKYCRIKSENPEMNLDKDLLREPKTLDIKDSSHSDSMNSLIDISHLNESKEPDTSESFIFEKSKLFNISDINYVPECFSSSEPLMYVNINILGNRIKALVDGGATRSFIGPKGLELIKQLGLKVEKNFGLVQVADSSIQTVSDEITAPIELETKARELKIRVLSSLPVDFVIGLDFLKMFGMSIDYENRKWIFNSNPFKSFDFIIENSKPEVCCGLSELNPEQTKLLEQFLDKEIPKDEGKPGLTSLIAHVIDVENHPPIKQRHYSVSPIVQGKINEEVDQMMQDDIIEFSKSGWSSPIVMIKKSDGSYRFCLDFRKLNNITKKDAYPLPKINSILDKLNRAKFISKLDIHKGFLNIPLESNSREKTAFSVPGKGHFQFK